MTTDDDKQGLEPDPWAGLDIGNGDAAEDAGAFDFSGLDDEPPTAFKPVVDELQPDEVAFSFEAIDQPTGEPSGEASAEASGEPLSPAVHDDEHAAANEIPLAVFPPPEAEADGSDVLIGTGRSGIIPMAEATDDPDLRDLAGGDHSRDDFDDNAIAHELGLADIESGQMAADAADSGSGLGTSADFGEPDGEMPAEDVSFDAGGGAGFPFADIDHLEEKVGSVADVSESGHDAASIAFASAAAVASGAAAAAPIVKQAGRQKKGNAIGQMVGVVLGGLMALPVTYAILIWGFHKDPFKLAKKAPAQLAFLLPEKLQPGAKTPKKAEKAEMTGGPKTGPSLDDVPTGDDVAAVADEPPMDAGGREPTATPEPTDVADSTDDSDSTDDAKVAAGDSKPDGESGEMDPAAEPASGPTEPVAPRGDALADLAVAAPRMAADPLLGAIAPLPGLDGLASADDAVPPAALPAAPPPLDMTGVEMAVERASQAFDALGAISDPADPDRDRLAVAWYKRLAQVGEELVRLETAAADSGRPLEQSPAAVAALLDRVCESDAARQDLEKLGRMWLTRQKQRANGVTLLVTLDSARQVGPYWSTKAMVSGAPADGSGDRVVAVISRIAPPAAAGERIMISGVLFDGDTVWAADLRPVDRPAEVGFGQE